MRRFPTSWSNTLAKLGLRLQPRKGRRRPTGQGSGRRSAIEQLESRELLTGTPWQGTELIIADFDGDGNMDRLRAAALSTTPEVWSVDTKSSSAAGTVEDWKVTRTGGVPAVMPLADQIVVGDFNGDGRDDLLSRTGSSTWYMIQSRASSTPATYQGEFVISPWSTVGTAGAWSTPIVGDFDGDGRDDLAAFDGSNPSNKQWQVARSTGLTLEPPTPENMWAQTTITPTSSSVVTGDFNDDGRDDLLFQKSGTSNWAVAISDGTRFNVIDPTSAVTTTWSTGRLGDFDGDGAEELLGWNSSWNNNAGRWETIRYSDHRGMSLVTSWGSALGTVVASQNTHVGDANRDGRDDLVIFDTTAGVNKWKVALSQPVAGGNSTFSYVAASANGTNDWNRWFDDWDWGPTATTYQFLNVDAPYQTFLDIFSDVYNTVELELYPGLMKGIEATAQTKAGNDWDQAALLVDRLEPEVAGQNEGQRARIASGKVNVDPGTAKEWIGTTTDGAAFYVIAQTLDTNANVVDGKYQFTHAWVQALVPSTDGLKWIDVDPSWKFKVRQTGEVVDLTTVDTGYTPIAGRNQRGTFDEFGYLQKAGKNQLPVEWYEDQVMQYLVQENTNKSLAEVPHDGPINQKRFETIPVGWGSSVSIASPNAVEAFNNFAQIRDSEVLSERLTHRAQVSVNRYETRVGEDFDLEISPDFVPATAQHVNATSPFALVDWDPTQIGGGHAVQNNSGVTTYDIYGSQFSSIWFPNGYNVTSKTRMRFELNAAGLANVNYVIGLDNNNVKNKSPSTEKLLPPDFPGATGGSKTFDLSIGSEYAAPTTVSHVVIGMWIPNAAVPDSHHAYFSKIVLYENDNTTVIDDSIIWQVDSATAAIDLPTPYTVTRHTRLELEFARGSEGHLHAIGWDNDFDGTNDTTTPYKRYKLDGSGSAAGYPGTSSGATTQDGFTTYTIAIGSHLTGGDTATMERLLFITSAGAISNAESVFRNVRLTEANVAWEEHLSQTFVVAEHSLDLITIDYTKQENSAATTGDDTYTAKLAMRSPNGTTTTINSNVGKVFNVNDEVKIHIDHLGPTDFQTSSPGIKTYTRAPGQIHAIGLDANQYSIQQIVRLQAELNDALADGASVADVDELLNYTAAKYWYELNRGQRTIDGLTHAVGGEQWVGSGIITSDPYLLTDSIPGLNGGTPVYTAEHLKHLQFPILPYNMGVDLPNLNHGSFDIGTGIAISEAFQLGGYNGSALENAVLEEVVNSRSVSTVRGIVNTLKDSSNSTGTWVFESMWDTSSNSRKFYRRGLITESSSTTTYNPTGGTEYTTSQLKTDTNAGLKSVHSDSVVQGIVSLLANSGSQERVVILVPNQKSVVDSWAGSVYVAEFENNDGSHGAYIIAPDGGTPTNGGFSGNARKPENVILPPSTFLNQTYAGDPVNVANGNMFRDEVDFTFANPIVPLDFERHYDTQNKLDVGFGVGWVHSFTGFIYQEQDPANSGDQDYVWLRGSGERHTFEDLNFTLPNTLFGDVESNGNSLTKFLDRSGTQYIFESIAGGFADSVTGKQIFGRLVAIKDASGHQGVTISYDDTPTVKSTRVKEVKSIATPSRYLQFSYSSNAVDVKRYEGNQLVSTWGYVLATHAGYTGKRLTQVKHANSTATATNYEYFTDGPTSRKGLIKKITEPNGESHSYEYYANGRVFRVTDGDGNQQSFNYNLFRNLTEFTDENGNVETYIHQDNGLLVKQIHDDRSRLEFEWGPQTGTGAVQWEEFLMKTSTDERGANEVFNYYSFSPSNSSQRPGELLTSQSKDEIVTTYEYENHAYISSVKKITVTPLGGSSTVIAQHTYDGNGNILTSTDAEGHKTTYEYYGGTDPAHLRGLRKSATQPKGVSGQTLANWELYEAVPWETITESFTITGDRISVQLLTAAIGQYVAADAIRLDRVDKDGVSTRIVDSHIATNDGRFRLEPGAATATLTNSNNTYGNQFYRIASTTPNQVAATWIFDDLEPGTYRISASWNGTTENTREHLPPTLSTPTIMTMPRGWPASTRRAPGRLPAVTPTTMPASSRPRPAAPPSRTPTTTTATASPSAARPSSPAPATGWPATARSTMSTTRKET